jgi:NADH dehydrogenase FAD-containing subunit
MLSPVTDYLADDLAGARGPGGRLSVTPELRVAGHDSVYAVGDVTDLPELPELKMARLAQKHAEVVRPTSRRRSTARPRR